MVMHVFSFSIVYGQLHNQQWFMRIITAFWQIFACIWQFRFSKSWLHISVFCSVSENMHRKPHDEQHKFSFVLLYTKYIYIYNISLLNTGKCEWRTFLLSAEHRFWRMLVTRQLRQATDFHSMEKKYYESELATVNSNRSGTIPATLQRSSASLHKTHGQNQLIGINWRLVCTATLWTMHVILYAME